MLEQLMALLGDEKRFLLTSKSHHDVLLMLKQEGLNQNFYCAVYLLLVKRHLQ